MFFASLYRSFFFCTISTTSTSYVADDRSWEIQYGVGMCSGVLSNDTVTIDGATAYGQVFAEATMLSGNFLNPNQPMDGILVRNIMNQ